ncbi:hypothetical protein [Winogradskyella sp.]|uniref:hypothetical protein n=1 Tax=Winogradskyella sp. TaxID=1883156 RepID=UPI0025F5AD28|nr:hypothetical protein [Winogradskyella sp.]
MRKVLVVLITLFFMSSCDDGDIITVDLDFDQDLSLCDNDIDTYLIYDLRNDPSESLSLLIQRNTANDLLFSEPTPVDTPTTLTIDGNTNRFIYRTYNRDISDTSTNQELCSTVIPADLVIIENYESTSGTAEVTVTVDDDDNDGIPSALEGADPNGDGDFSDSLDSDLDGIFDYLDQDDDNDNVLTIDEIDSEDTDGDDDPTTNPLDTDGDTIPDYLDTDDDEDGILTINEDENGDMSPANDLANNALGDLVPHYLNTIETIDYGNPGNTQNNQYTRTVNSVFIIKNFDLDILSGDEINLGTLITTIIIQQ